MKKILKISALFLLVATAFSCEDDDIPTANMNTPQNGPVLITPESGTAIVLSPDQMANPALTLAWEDAAYTVQTPITYTVEVATAGTDFAAPIVAATTTSKSLTWTVEQLNGLAINPEGLNLTPYTEGEFDVRVVSGVGLGTSQQMASNPITITITPYTTANPEVYVIGNFLAASGYGADWSPAATLPSLQASAYGKTDFEGFVYMNVPTPEFKILPTNTSFDGDYGDDGSFAGTLLQDGEQNIPVTGAGYYYIKANTGVVSPTNPDGMTYSATQTTWGIAGNGTANGWDGMIPMTYDAASKTWSIVATLSTQAAPDNGLKFKANGAWDLNLGDTGADGSAEFNGTNIGTTAGTYLIKLDLSNPRQYSYTITPQP